MKRQRFWLLAAAALFGLAAFVVAQLAEATRPGTAPDERPIPGTAAALPTASPPLKQNEGTDFPNMRPTPQGASEAGRAVAAAPADAGVSKPVPYYMAKMGPPPDGIARTNRSDADGGTGTGPFRITPAGIKAAMRQSLPEMKDCYEQWLKMQPTLGGTLKVKFVISPDDDAGVSRVQQVGLAPDSGMGSVAFEGCVLNTFSDVEFDHQPNSTSVTYPIAFSSGDEAENPRSQ